MKPADPRPRTIECLVEIVQEARNRIQDLRGHGLFDLAVLCRQARLGRLHQVIEIRKRLDSGPGAARCRWELLVESWSVA